MPRADAPRFFFIHVMKTAGTTFRSQAAPNFARGEMFPNPFEDLTDLEKILRSIEVRRFFDMPTEQRDQIRFFAGHVPYAAAAMTCPEAITLAIVRDPVDRTLSYLRHCQRGHAEHQSLPLEEIYEDPWYFPRYIENHQTKIFSMTAEETLRGQYDPPVDRDQPPELIEQIKDDPASRREIERILRNEEPTARTLLRLSDRAPTEVVSVDDRRLADALANLERVDVLGVTEDLDSMLATLVERYGWHVAPSYVLNATTGGTVAESFRHRIAADNAADVELYERACHLTRR
jgi:Sulfotransferase family